MTMFDSRLKMPSALTEQMGSDGLKSGFDWKVDGAPEIDSEAARSNASVWYLYTELASGLYEKLGWRHLERCEYKGVTVDVMRKQITS